MGARLVQRPGPAASLVLRGARVPDILERVLVDQERIWGSSFAALPTARPEAAIAYRDRYLTVFGPGELAGLHIGVDIHSAAGTAVVATILSQLGATVVSFGESDDFVALDTEALDDKKMALYRTRIAHVLVAQGRDDDALAELEQARSVFADAPKWKAARARVLAHRGQTAEAVALARDAAALMDGNDDVTTHAEILVDLAEVLHAHGDRGGAADALAKAVALHEEKGNLVSVANCRGRLAAIAAGHATTST